MFDKLGPAKYVVPFVVVILVTCVMSILFYPMIHMEVKNLPFAVLSLDEGVEAGGASVNAGDSLVENIQDATASDDGEDSTIVWTTLDSQDELDEAIENNEYYGAVIIPENFSEVVVAAQAKAAAAAAASAAGTTDAAATATDASAASADASAAAAAAAAAAASADSADETESATVTIILDNAKSPLIVAQLKTSIASMFEEQFASQGLDVAVDVQVVHEGSTESSSSALSPMMSQQIAIMPLFLMSMIGSILLTQLFDRKKAGTRAGAVKAIGLQAALAVAVSLAIGLCAYFAVSVVAEVDIDAGASIPFFWMVSLCLILFFIGAFNIAFPLGALCAALIMCLGMTSGVLPVEIVPQFWQDWVFPWAPQHFIGNGLRDILFMGAGAWNVGSAPMAVYGAVGIVLLAIAAALPVKKGGDAPAAPAESGTPAKPKGSAA